MPATVYISLGTNMGDRMGNLRQAASALEAQMQVKDHSPVYQTPPWGYTDQAEFLNQVICGETELSPQELLFFLKDLEAQLGRQPSFRYGPRLIDMDILFYDDQVLEVPGLSIPHPKLHERAFVMVPLADLAPEIVHPRLGMTVRDLLENLETEGVEPYHDEINGGE
jgi:2-amino-4-hydroxy-6-hydroxymethyldihydropteridine diphosphokinase